MSLDSTTTASSEATTECLYHGSTGDQSGDLCDFHLTAWADAQSANSDYTQSMNEIVKMGGPVQSVTGVGDAAYYLATDDGWLTVLKGSNDFTDKCFFVHGQQLVSEQVDIQIAQLLVSRI
jgi:hypothetical protein